MTIQKKIFNFFLSGSGLNLRYAITLFVFEILLGITGYAYLEDYNFSEAFYMTMITISTVGYGEVRALSPIGQTFTTFFILLNLGVFAYSASAFSFFIVQGQIFKTMRKKDLSKKIKTLTNHVIVCGYGRYGREIAHHFESMKVPFVVIESDDQIINEIESTAGNILFIHGDSTLDEILIEAGIKNAKSLVIALHNDTCNLYTVLSARQLNPGINIISRAQDQKANDKLLLAGATHVVMPKQIGGFYMASLVTKPDAVEFFTFMTTEYNTEITFEEFHYDQLPEQFKDKSLSDINFRNETGANVVGYKNHLGKYIVNPSPNQILEKGSSIIVLGTPKQIEKTIQVLRSHK